LLGQSVLLAFSVADLVLGTPDTYLNQHARLAANAGTGICIALSFLVLRLQWRFVALAGATVTIVASLFLLR
jgi:hypothetical protein